jgi:hypothetical protein
MTDAGTLTSTSPNLQTAPRAGVLDLTGKIFGKLVVIRFAGTPWPRYGAMWRCRCACGRVVDVRSDNLLTGNSRSCGCGRRGARRRRSTGEYVLANRKP